MIFRFACEIYKADVAVLIEPTKKEVNKFIEKNLEKNTISKEDTEELLKEIEAEDNNGFMMAINDKYLICIKKRSEYIISHEIYHLANHILMDRGIEHTLVDEPYAYFIGWLNEIIREHS